MAPAGSVAVWQPQASSGHTVASASRCTARNTGVGAGVLEEGKDPARPQHAGNLGQRASAVGQ
jgi:hypothetical protein